MAYIVYVIMHMRYIKKSRKLHEDRGKLLSSLQTASKESLVALQKVFAGHIYGSAELVELGVDEFEAADMVFKALQAEFENIK